MKLRSLPLLLALALPAGIGVDVVLAEEACTPAQAAKQAEDLSLVVLRGLLNHETLPEIDADVLAALRALDAGATEIDVAAVVEDAITLLLDSGLVPSGLIPAAQQVRTEAHTARRTSPAAVRPQ